MDDIDYKSIWIKWDALLKSDAKNIRDILEHLHIEITKGFDVITRIATEEIREQTKIIDDSIESDIAQLVLKGYLLYFVQNNIDPMKVNLVERTTSNELGNKWMEHYEKDKGADLFGKIDPVLSLIMEKESSTASNNLFYQKEDREACFKEYAILAGFYNWSIHQGYIIAILENE